MTKQENGIMSELFAQLYFIKENYKVSKPINDFYEYDLIIDKETISRVQIKTIYFDNSKKRYITSLVTSHRRGNNKIINKKYQKNSFDLLCCVNLELKAIYIIPINEINNSRSITFYPISEIGKFENFRVM